MQLLSVAELRCVERSPEKRDRFVVHLQRYRERMSVFPAVRKREARRILEPRRGTMDDLCHQRERLQRARSELFQKQKGGKVADIALVGEREHRAEPSLVQVRLADIVMRRHLKAAHFGERAYRILSGDGEQGTLRLLGAAIHQVADLTT